jgi:hypothetical protein
VAEVASVGGVRLQHGLSIIAPGDTLPRRLWPRPADDPFLRAG